MNNILEKLDGLEARFEEVGTLITDPAVIADQQRYVKLTKEYKELEDIMAARKKYVACLNAIKEAKDVLANEKDPDMKELAREELSENEDLQPKLEEEIKLALVPKDPEDAKNVQMEIRAVLVVMRLPFSPATSSTCTNAIVKRRAGSSLSPMPTRVR